MRLTANVMQTCANEGVRHDQYFESTLKDIRELTVLSYTPQAEVQYQEWRKRKLRGSTHDLRIAAICIAHSVKLATTNRRDFEHIPGLSVEFWE